MKIQLKGGDIKEFDKPISVLELAKSISPSLARDALGAFSAGETLDLRYEIKEDREVEIIKFQSKEGKAVFWHSSAHLLAQAVKRLYPEAELAIGPSIENGFYYDIDYKRPITEDELIDIEKEMRNIVREKLDVTRFELPREEAIEYVRNQKESYKEELIRDLPEDSVISFYTQGEFTDLCRGPHIMNTKEIKAFKLMKVAGAYWRGDEKNKMLTRIYGISFPKEKELKEYLHMLEEAKKRDHRKLGRELELFTVFEEGPGFPVYLDNGNIVIDELVNFWKKIHRRENYQIISTPTMLSKDLWERSGHWSHYRENMYTSEIDEKEFAIKPMNCPGGMLEYKKRQVSYRDLPLRVGELGLVHRHELSGALQGLLRVRSFTQDDAHIYMSEDQIKDEIKNLILLVDEIYGKFNLGYNIELSTRPENHIGKVEDWDKAEKTLKEALEESGREYQLNPGDGAFYGPKIDFHLIDSLGRTHQCGTIQLDFQLPERFEIDYIASDGTKKRPIMIHRAIYGSIERFLAIIIEHYAGAFPLWLAPEQIKILSISEDFNDYCIEIEKELKKEGFRVKSDLRNERISYKIREAGARKIPYLLIIGAKEKEEKTISIRPRGEIKNLGMKIPEFIEKLNKELKV